MPFNLFRNKLYSADDLYAGYQLGKPESYKDSYDSIVYQHYLKKGKRATDIKETLGRTLHDHSMTDAMYDFLSNFDAPSFGSRGGTRTHKRLILSQQCLPIPPLGRFVSGEFH